MILHEVYADFVEKEMALPVIRGLKSEKEKFPGALRSYSIEAMMQDGKALQAGTSHYLGTGFSEAAGIRYQDQEGGQQLCHTTSWGVTTRLIGGVIMTHGDDDGLRCPPQIAPQQVVIVPMLRDNADDEAILDYCKALQSELAQLSAFGEPVRALFDRKATKAATKRWGWVKKGAPIIVEVGARDVAGGNVSVLRRDRLYRADGKTDSAIVARDAFVADVPAMLADIEATLYAEARGFVDANIERDITDKAALEAWFDADRPGWAEVNWAKPTGAALDAVVEWLKARKLTLRNVPLDSAPARGPCIFTDDKAVERVLVGRAY